MWCWCWSTNKRSAPTSLGSAFFKVLVWKSYMTPWFIGVIPLWLPSSRFWNRNIPQRKIVLILTTLSKIGGRKMCEPADRAFYQSCNFAIVRVADNSGLRTLKNTELMQILHQASEIPHQSANSLSLFHKREPILKQSNLELLCIFGFFNLWRAFSWLHGCAGHQRW